MKIDEIRNFKKYVEGGSFNNGFLDKLADRYSQQNSSSISTFDIIFSSNRVNELIKDGISYKCVVDYGNLPSKANVKSAQRSFHHEVWTKRNDNIRTGDIVEFSHDPLIDKKTFIIMNTLKTRDQYDLNVMQITQGTLKWLNSSGVIKETPFTQKSTSSAYPLEEDKIMILSKERRNILVQANEDTLGIDKGQRFIFDRRCWKVVGFDGLTTGLLELTVEEDQIHSSIDNLALRIADYNGKVTDYKVLVLNGSTNSLALDDTLQLNIRVTNRGFDIPSPLLHFSSSDDSIATVSETGLIQAVGKGEVIVHITYKDVSSSININVTDRRTYNYTLDIIGSDEVKISKSQKYQVSFFNNGEPISDTAKFSLTSLDGTPTQLATLKPLDNTTCEITAGKAIGKIVLNVSNQNGLITNKKEIKIKSLI
ncbi:hypothetical protein A616_17370 [Brevibacillus brevis X23]|nr:hypothetical protein A616_17370 [Brevibacillus brevis X23]